VDSVLNALASQGIIGQDKKDLAGSQVYRGDGCDVCKGSGYIGRIGLFEVLEIDETMRELIYANASMDAMTQQAQKMGMQTLLENGIQKVFTGLTTVEEVLRVTRE
jgi:type II secretory ATPase GspE/PulE/Tfp pilus assembly ATPase PilB-like protein